MKLHHESHHAPHHWIPVALILAAMLLTLSDAHGQQGAAAVFAGRPAMAGAQGGLGAQAGLPQGGIGLQGNQGAERAIGRKPAALENMPQGRPDEGIDVVATSNIDMRLGLGDKDIVRKKDPGIAREQRSAVKKSKRAVHQVVKRARTGVGDIEAGG